MDAIEPLIRLFTQAQAAQPAGGHIFRRDHTRILRHVALVISVLLTATQILQEAYMYLLASIFWLMQGSLCEASS